MKNKKNEAFNGNRIEADYLLKELEEIAKIFASSILTLKGKRNI